MDTFTFVAHTNCEPGRDEAFNEWYDRVHVPEVLAIDGFVDATRYRVEPVSEPGAAHHYLAVYTVAAPSAEEAQRRLAAAGLVMTADMSPGSRSAFYRQISTTKH